MIAPESSSRVTIPFHHLGFVVWLFVAFGAVLTAAPNSNAQSIVFGAGTTYPAGSGPWGLVAADFNGDGHPDLAVANHGTATGTFGNGVIVLLGNADGTLQSAVTYPGGIGPTHLLSADLNRDGKLDLVTANSESNSFSVLFGNGNGTFQPNVDYSVSDRPASVIAADFNRDGYPDLALTIKGSIVSVLLGTGNGGFGPTVNYQVPLGPFELVSGDFNGDGKLDILTSSTPTRTVSVLLGNGDGTFQTAINSSTGGSSQPGAMAVGDFNRDGKADVGVAFIAPPSVNIMLGNGNGSFSPPSFVAAADTPVDLKAGDFNGDGKLDLVSTGIFIGPHAQVFLGNGDGTLKTPVGFGMGPGAISVTVADFNNDTRPDLALVANGQVSVVLLNATPGQPDHTDYFVHQHYLDFLSREPDVFGFDYWTSHIDQCVNDPTCTFERRIGTSAAFMVESEFQQAGYFVHRLYKASFGRRPTYAEFTVDSKKVIGGPQLEASKTTLVDAFAQSNQFKSVYPDSLTNQDFVNRLFDSAALIPFTTERQAAVVSLNLGASRASVLRSVVDNPALTQREYNPAFVQMQYFGYLRRDEEQPGYQFWLDILNAQPNNFRRMVCAFITSAEYQHRFSNNVTHTNAECGP